jgi:hypothetical protein
MRRVLPAVAVVLASAVGGCASSAASPRLGPADRDRLYLAGQILVGRCMERADLRYVAVPAPPGSSRSTAYSSDDAGERERHGYRRDPPRDPNAAYLSTLSTPERTRYQSTLLGARGAPVGRVRLLDGTDVRFPLTGCVAEAREELYGDNDRYMVVSLFVENLRGEVERRVLADARYLAVLRAWRECMRGAGYPSEDPGGAALLAQRRPAAEREIAVADATCSRGTGLTATGLRLDREQEQDVYAEHADRVREYARLREDGAARARAIVAS